MLLLYLYICGLPWWLSDKESACNTGDVGLVPGLGRSPGKGNGNLLHYSCLENSMDRGGWQATVYGITKESDMTELLSTHTHTSEIIKGVRGAV